MNEYKSDLSGLINYEKKEVWETYFKQLRDEKRQCEDEGIDMSGLNAMFDAVIAMPDGALKEKAADDLYQMICAAPRVEGYKYDEPSDIEGICAARPAHEKKVVPYDESRIADQVRGAWLGRIVGCMLGKTVEGIRTPELWDLLKQSGNFPMHRYILKSDLPADYETHYKFGFKYRAYADCISCMPADDDTNYTSLYQQLICRYGRDFTCHNVAAVWQMYQPKTAYCTAERVAYMNMLKGIRPPETASYQNPYREWIGAQIRADYFGYINPGDTETAANMAFRDACISHVKNGIYGEMFVAAMIAEAAVETDLLKIIKAGLDEIPENCRLAESVRELISDYLGGMSAQEYMDKLHTVYDEFCGHHWCHTISNALIVCACLLYGKGDFSCSICMAVQQGFDTDCNGATVGSILGMRNGSSCIGKEWTSPIHNTLETQIINVGKVSIDTLIEKTLEHIKTK